MDNDFAPRYIETMPMGDLGYERQKYYMPYITLSEVEDRPGRSFRLTPVAMRKSPLTMGAC